MVMYHEERVQAKEMLSARTALISAMQIARFSLSVIPTLLKQWGVLIATKFKADNLHLLDRTGAPRHTLVTLRLHLGYT